MAAVAKERPHTLSPRRAALVFSNLGRTIALLWRLDRVLTLRYVAISVFDAILPVLIAYVGKEIVDAVIHATHVPPHRLDGPLRWVAVELALIVAKNVSGQISGYYSTILRSRMAAHVEVMILDKALRLSLRHFEDSDFMDMLERARKESSWRPVEIITHGLSLGKNAITLIGYGGLLLRFSGWATLALACASLPFLAEMHFAGAQHTMRVARTHAERQAWYLQALLTNEAYAKEIKLLSIGRMLVERYQTHHTRFLREDEAFARRRGTAVTFLGALSALTFYAIYAWIVARTVAGAITLGSMTLYLTVFRQGQGAFQSSMSTLARTYEDNLYINNLFQYLAIPDDDAAEAVFDAPKDEAGPPEIRFEGVSFAYEGSETPVLDAIDVAIKPGETVAVVGPNGAGKTTLVKLLTGLHKPTRGVVRIGGRDVNDVPRGALRARIGVVFQDFVRYHFTAADNVGVGWLPKIGDREALERAARNANVAAELAKLPSGYDTMLGRWFGGIELSVGQWQRVALARAFARESDVLILDEPTAALDAEAEHEVFERFRELRAGRTAILITHRFSTVRMADRIIVLDRGRIVEQGTHAELLALNGLYARMFNRQAAGYVGPELAA